MNKLPDRPLSLTGFLTAFKSVMTVFFDAERDLLIMLSGDGNIERVNPAFERVLGRPESTVLGQPFIALVVADDLAKFLHSFTPRRAYDPIIFFRLLHANNGVVTVYLDNPVFDVLPDQPRVMRTFMILRCEKDLHVRP